VGMVADAGANEGRPVLGGAEPGGSVGAGFLPDFAVSQPDANGRARPIRLEGMEFGSTDYELRVAQGNILRLIGRAEGRLAALKREIACGEHPSRVRGRAEKVDGEMADLMSGVLREYPRLYEARGRARRIAEGREAG
jgi:hypothetical protein